ncbi:histidine kinase [Pseudoflavitalea sp. G-6-1-2]|uniref:sensor histidine kinase n=1 Tax=Pseudoflavitalea sp. G-6-1-2 TaxID=2728841 RepID=UPI00146A0CEC|nr:histidine kinase [Pseudoflavitalea sp. G-6-1-2]NML23940.1 histidine kinase [Pseudoflavitalea sp. G-6-1-2]
MLHTILWVPSIAIPLVLMPLKEGYRPDSYMSLGKMPFTIMQIGIFYLMVYYLYPKYFLKKKVKTYLLSIVVLCIALAVSSAYIHCAIEGKFEYQNLMAGMIMKFLIAIAVMATGTSFLLITYVVREQRLQSENLRTELGFLRSQVSPHFMFNTLNSMVSLARKKSDKLEPALMELSNLMHYMLYESDEEKVSIQREIDYLQSYIDLQTLRFGHHVRISFEAEQPPEDFAIEPMLLIPLVENAFKHGVGMIEDPEIIVQLKVIKDEVLLMVQNKFNRQGSEAKDKTSGIGLTNLKRRLGLLYPNRHMLNMVSNGVYYNASLKIQMHDPVPGC